MRFGLRGLVGAVLALTTPAHAQNYPWCAQYSGRALGRSDELRLCQLRAVHGNRFRYRRVLRAKHDVPAAAVPASEEEKSLIYWRWRRRVSACPERSNLAAPY